MYLYSFLAGAQNSTLSLHISILNDHSSLECKARGFGNIYYSGSYKKKEEKNESETFFNSVDCGIWLSKECWQRKYSISS